MNPGHSMSCGETREKLPLYVGGDLDPDILDEVRAHLGACRDCARRSEEAVRARRGLVAAFRAREEDFQSPGLWPTLRATLRAEGLIHDAGEPLALPSVPARARRSLRSWALAPLAAAAVLLFALQLSGVFRSRGSALPGQGPAPTPIAGPEVVIPTVAPGGGLQRIDPLEAESRVLVPYQHRSGRENGSGPLPGDIRQAGYRGVR
jgi:anti-sigma factor RsiW